MQIILMGSPTFANDLGTFRLHKESAETKCATKTSDAL